MFTRTFRPGLVWLCLVLQFSVALAGTRGLMLCVTANGHVALEDPAEAGCCPELAPHRQAVDLAVAAPLSEAREDAPCHDVILAAPGSELRPTAGSRMVSGPLYLAAVARSLARPSRVESCSTAVHALPRTPSLIVRRVIVLLV